MGNRHPRIRSASKRSGCFRPLALELLEPRTLLAGLPLGALPQDTGAYMLGDVAVSLVLMESIGEESSEDWNGDSIDAIKAKIRQSLDWWEETLEVQSTVHSVRFHLDVQHADNPVPTEIEPIAHVSNDYQIWVDDFLDHVNGNSSADISTDMRLFNHQQRSAIDADWGFTIFVANDENDNDGLFAAGGSFRRAFAFAGGRYFIMPASRPVVTATHEVGHMFWARDEYSGGGSYLDRRGYYNTQNLNAANNPAPGFSQVESIMASSSLMNSAFSNHTSSSSSLEMIGWKDSDQDGIFDALDIPLLLEGSGFPDPSAGLYHFQGSSRVQALPNRNPSGFQSDITINTIDVVEYRVDSGNWQTVATPGDPVVSIDVSFAVPAGDYAVEIRTRALDVGTGQTVATSNSLVGNATFPAVTQQSGIAGYVFADGDGDGAWDAGEVALTDWKVQIVDTAGQARELWTRAEPDNFDDTAILNQAFPGITVRSVGGGTAGDTVYSRQSLQSSTGGRVFANFNTSLGAIRSNWNDTNRQLRIDFDDPVTAVRVDAIGNGGTDFGRLEIYDDQATLLARYTTEPLAWGEIETMQLSRSQGDIAYAVAGAHYSSDIHLDQLRVGALAETSSDAAGAFWLDELEAGSFLVNVIVPDPWQATEPASATRQVTLAGGQLPGQLSFGILPPAWHNVVRRHDVSGDGNLVPLDALMVINDLNTLGARNLPVVPTPELSPPPYLDVNADGAVTSLDALQVINELNNLLSGEPVQEQRELSLHALAVAAEAEPEPDVLQSPADSSSRNAVDRAWADLWSASQLHWPGGVAADLDAGPAGAALPSTLPAQQLDEIIGDDLHGESWLEWSITGRFEDHAPGE